MAPKTDDSYGGFSEVYDAWQLLYPKAFSVALAPRIVDAVRRHPPPRSVLADIACGTGTFALWWQRRHPSWRVYATDLSPGMIAGAKRAARQSASGAAKRRGLAAQRTVRRGRGSRRPLFVVQDMRRLELPEPAGVVTCLFDSLNHVTRDADLARVFRRVARALAPGGLFLFDLIDELAFPEVFTGTSILDGPALYAGIDTSFREERGRGIGTARFTFFRRRGAGWRRIEFDIRERRWFRGEVREMLHEARLDLVQLQRIDPYESDEFFVPRTFWVCRRA
jgi:SAM-dependent methyltransferase